MNIKEYLLLCLAEECGEVQRELYTTHSLAIKDKLEFELNDLLAVNKMLIDKCILNYAEVNEFVFNKDLFICINDIQYFTHKAMRFGLEDNKDKQLPLTNKLEIENNITLLKRLMVDNNIPIWDNVRLQVKIDKVTKYYERSILNGTLESVDY